MCNIVTFKSTVKTDLSVMEKINQKSPLYLCIDCENMPTLCTPNKRDAERYANQHFCTISFYDVGTYCEDNIKPLYY